VKIQKCDVTGAWLVVRADGSLAETGPFTTREAARSWVRSAKAQRQEIASAVAPILGAFGPPDAEPPPAEQPNHEPPAVDSAPATLPTGVEGPAPAPLPELFTGVSHRTSVAPSPRALGRRTALGLALRVTGLDDLLPGALQGPAQRGVVVAPYSCLPTGRTAI
jgi:hypothetical protein